MPAALVVMDLAGKKPAYAAGVVFDAGSGEPSACASLAIARQALNMT